MNEVNLYLQGSFQCYDVSRHEKKVQCKFIINAVRNLDYFIMDSRGMQFNSCCSIRLLSYFRTRLRALDAHLPTPASDMSWNGLYLLFPCVTVIVRIIIEYFIVLANVIQISFRLRQTFACCLCNGVSFCYKRLRRKKLSSIRMPT